MLDLVFAGEAVALVLVLGMALWALYRLLSPPLLPTNVVAVDEPDLGGMRTLSSARYRLSGRPDELRRALDGRVFPVEVKSTRSPRSGVPYHSHRIQLLAYCLLVEETYGRTPTHGILSYGDGTEIPVPWDAGARAELLGVLEAWRAPYLGEMDPSPPKCRACQFQGGCPGRASVGAAS